MIINDEFYKNIISKGDVSPCIIQCIELIKLNNLSRISLKNVLLEYNIKNIEDIKHEALNFLIDYINFILNDDIIRYKERENIELLKRYFKIREGDFFKYKSKELDHILQKQFAKIYLDNFIDNKEALHCVELQALFNLSFDQFTRVKYFSALKAIESGVNKSELDVLLEKIETN